MKKITLLLLALTLGCAVICGCNSQSTDPTETKKQAETQNKPDTKPVEPKTAFRGTADDVLNQIVAKAIELDTDKEYGIKSIECTNVPVDEDSCTDILGLTTEEFTSQVEAAVESKPNGSWFSHSVVVVKLKDGADTQKLAEKIVKNTSPSRFGCLKADAVVGGYAGQFVIFSASSATTTEAVFGAFAALSAVAPTRIDRTNDWSGGGFFG